MINRQKFAFTKFVLSVKINPSEILTTHLLALFQFEKVLLSNFLL